MENELVIGGPWMGKPMMRASEILKIQKEFLLRLEEISPWSRPFDVSGTTRDKSNLPIAVDLSDFDDVMLRALDDKEFLFLNEDNPENKRITPKSRCHFGFEASFSDTVQRESDITRVTVHVGGGGNDGRGAASVRVKSFERGQENEPWSKPDVALSIFEMILNFGDPYFCNLYSTDFDNQITQWGIDQYYLGWLSFTKNLKVRTALEGHPNVTNYRDGILIKLGDNISVFKDTTAKTTAIEIRDALRAAGAIDWMEGAELHNPSWSYEE